MKKHIIAIVIMIIVLSAVGVGIYFVASKTNKQSLYNANTDFVYSVNTKTLTDNIAASEELYQSKISTGESRLTELNNIIKKLDTFEKDLNVYLMKSSKKTSQTNSLSKKYKTLTSKRESLINNYAEFYTRIDGNTNIDGNFAESLYDEIFDITVSYVYDYNSCFESTCNYVFGKLYTANSIKPELYALYSGAVKDLLNTISNHQFATVSLVNRLTSGINLVYGNIVIKHHTANSTFEPNLVGGEFSAYGLSFQKYFNASNKEVLTLNFENYYHIAIDPTIETSNEKLAVYYAKQILEI